MIYRWWADSEIGFVKIYAALKKLSEQYPHQPWLQPCELLIAVAQSGSTLREELFFRKKQNKK